MFSASILFPTNLIFCGRRLKKDEESGIREKKRAKATIGNEWIKGIKRKIIGGKTLSHVKWKKEIQMKKDVDK